MAGRFVPAGCAAELVDDFYGARAPVRSTRGVSGKGI